MEGAKWSKGHPGTRVNAIGNSIPIGLKTAREESHENAGRGDVVIGRI